MQQNSERNRIKVWARRLVPVVLILTFAIGTFWFLNRDDYSAAATKKVYQENCTDCHSATYDDFKKLHLNCGNSILQIREAINNGLGSIPAHSKLKGLSKKEATHLARFICDLQEEWIVDTMVRTSTVFDTARLSTELLKLRLDTVLLVPANEFSEKGWLVPTGIGFLNNGGLLVTIREGLLLRKGPDGSIVSIKGVPEVYETMHGGLLDVEVLHETASDVDVLLSYSYATTAGFSGTHVIKATVVEDSLVNITTFYKGETDQSDHEYGSKIRIAKDSTIFISLGNRGKKYKFQLTPDISYGKIHRFNFDGTVPADNPFVGNKDVLPTIYSQGHRNPQGLAIDPSNGNVWAAEHGPRGGDELNRIVAGADYGWPRATHGREYDGHLLSEYYDMEGVKAPVLQWTPSIAVSGIEFVSSERYPQWYGNILAISMKFRCLYRMVIQNDEVVDEEVVLAGLGRPREIQQGPDGYLYITYEGEGATVIRIVPQVQEQPLSETE